MTYTFTGFLSEATVAELKGIDVQLDIRSYDLPIFMTAVRIQDNSDGLRRRVLAISKLLPHRRFVAMYYSTFGGSIEYCCGFACQNGNIIHGTDLCGEDEDGDVAFRGILSGMEIMLPSSGYFRPFERSHNDL